MLGRGSLVSLLRHIFCACLLLGVAPAASVGRHSQAPAWSSALPFRSFSPSIFSFLFVCGSLCSLLSYPCS